MVEGSVIVVAGCPIRNRAWIAKRLDQSLALNLIEVDGDARRFYLVNDCTDETERVLRETDAVVDIENTGALGWHRYGEGTGVRYDPLNLARLRNVWAEKILERWPEATHLWSCDSDVIPYPDVLAKLLAANKPVVAAVVRNNAETAFNFTDWDDELGTFTRRALQRRLNPGASRHGYPWRLPGVPFRVGLTGACYLIRRDVLDAGVRWELNDQGEDHGFCESARDHGIELWVEPRARTQHWWAQDTVYVAPEV